jgi:DNA-binding SARP family transcriptional activator
VGESTAEARIYLLGRFAVEVSGRAIPAASWRKRRPIELLTAVALAPGRVLHREELIDRLWPDKDLDAGANNLHRAFHDLRRITGMEIATLDRGAARLAEHAWVDVVAFEQAAAGNTRETLQRAIELHAGALLPDDPYSDALVTRREGLRQRFVDAGLRLAKLHHAADDPEACVDVLRRVLDQDPALEPAHQLLMRVLAELGRAADALRQFGECTNALRARLDVAPSRATLELRAAIERGEVRPKAVEPPRIETKSDAALFVRRLLGGDRMRQMHGRADAVQTVRTFVGGGRGVLLVVGEAGLGKTRLAGECARIGAEQGARVLVGVGLDQESGVPYASFADAWAHHRRTTGASEASDPFASFSPSTGSAQEDRLRLFQSVERAVETLSERGAVCIVIEDLHDADPSSLHLFHHLSRATRSLPLLLVGTLREEEVRVGTPLHTLLGSLGRERLASRIMVERLDREATARLVEELAGTSEPEVVDAVYALAEGNPFHTQEVVRAMREEGTTRPTAPADLLETVRLRVRRLGRDAERLFAAAAVVGMRFPFEVARLASNLPPELALEILDLGIEAHIVEEDAGEVRFRHALTRTALLSALTHARRVYLHRAIAEVFEGTTGTAPEVLALHHEAAGQLDRALPHLMLAGERAQKRLGFSEAIAFFERARSVMDAIGLPRSEGRFRVQRALGGMRIALSDLDGAVRDLDDAATLATNAGEIAMVKRIAALALIQGGRLEEAGIRLDGALAALRDGDARDPELPAVLYLFAQLRWHEEKYVEARELAERSLAEAEARADRRAMSKGHEMLALCCHSLGAWQEGQAHEVARQALADGTLDVDQAFDVHLCLWEYHLYSEQGPSTIRTAVDQTLEQAQRMKAPRAVALCESFAGTLDFQAGRWNEAESQLRRAIDRFRQVGSASGEALSIQRLAVLLTARGDLDAARAMIDEGIVVGGRAAMRSHCLTRLHATLARNRLAADDRDGAYASLREGLAEAARHGHCATCNAHLLPEAVRVELAWGNQREADAYATKLEDVAERFGTRAWSAIATQARARVLSSRGDKAEAFAAFERARVAFEELGSPYEAARCLMAAGRVLGGARGRALMKTAKEAFSALGAADLEA